MAPVKSAHTLSSSHSSSSSYSHSSGMKNTIDSYFNKKNSSNTTNIASTAATTTRFTKENMPPIYCDLDGVLADHDRHMIEIHGSNWRSLYHTKGTTSLYTNDFFNTIPWMNDGKILWNSIKEYRPTILTALPNCNNDNVYDNQKRQWCRRELGTNVQVITTKGPWSKYRVSSLLSSLLSSTLP